jgi:hypothetical protein
MRQIPVNTISYKFKIVVTTNPLCLNSWLSLNAKLNIALAVIYIATKLKQLDNVLCALTTAFCLGGRERRVETSP